MTHPLSFEAFFGVAVLALCGLLVLVFALWWMRTSIRRTRASTASRMQPWIAASLALAAAIGMVGLALLTARSLPRAIERAELIRQHAELMEAIEREQAAFIGQPARNLTFHGIADGRRYDLRDFRGNVVLLNFWATWCGPCRWELPHLERLQADLRPRGLTVIHLSGESRATVGRYVEERNLANLHTYADKNQWPALGLPTSYVVDRDGVVRGILTGGTDYDRFADMVKPYL